MKKIVLMLLLGLPGILCAAQRVESEGTKILAQIAQAEGNKVSDWLKSPAGARLALASRDDTGNTALHGAACTGNTALMHQLIEIGISCNAQNEEGQTPLHTAAYYEKPECVKVLLNNRANLTMRDARGRTPLRAAFESPFYPIESLKLLHEGGARLRELPESVMKPLPCCALFGQNAVLRALLSQRDPVLCSQQQKNLALSLAVSFGMKSSAEILLREGANPEGDEGSQGLRCLHKAIKKGDSEMVRLLIMQGANREYHDEQAMRPLCLAAQEGHLACVSALLDAQTFLEGRYHGKTALHYAAEAGYLEVVELLLLKGALIGAQDSFGKTALHYALTKPDNPCVKKLVLYGANLTVPDNQGESPLRKACAQGLKDAIILMVCTLIKPSAKEVDEAATRLKMRGMSSVPSTYEDFEKSPEYTEENAEDLAIVIGQLVGQVRAGKVRSYKGLMVRGLLKYLSNNISLLFTDICSVPNAVHPSVQHVIDPQNVAENFTKPIEDTIEARLEKTTTRTWPQNASTSTATTTVASEQRKRKADEL